MEIMKRTADCGSLRKSDAGRTVILNGWVHRKREHGGVSFINLRDRYGVTQVLVDTNEGAGPADGADTTVGTGQGSELAAVCAVSFVWRWKAGCGSGPPIW